MSRGRQTYNNVPVVEKECRVTLKNCSSSEVVLAANIHVMLPQLDCGECGYDNCLETAKAIARGDCEANICQIAGEEIAPVIDCIKKLEVMCDEVSGFRTVETSPAVGKTGLEVR
ncbi:MAG: (Fe-S)-binding protein [Archaeoglobaceae archaeon]